jgi:hypothetical protein
MYGTKNLPNLKHIYMRKAAAIQQAAWRKAYAARKARGLLKWRRKKAASHAAFKQHFNSRMLSEYTRSNPRGVFKPPSDFAGTVGKALAVQRQRAASAARARSRYKAKRALASRKLIWNLGRRYR